MLPILALAKGLDLYRIAAYAAVVAAIFLAGVSYGISREAGKQLDRVMQEAAAAQKIIIKQGAVTVKRVVVYRDRVVNIRVAEERSDEKLDAVVPVTECAVPYGFRLWWDSANTASVPETTGRDVRTPTDLTLGDIAAQKRREAGICLRCEESLAFCRQWVRDQYETTNGVKLEY